MDFSENLMQEKGHGNYCYLKPESFPKLFLAYLTDPSDSGRIHSNVYTRWSNGDQDVVDGMKKFADLTTEAKDAIITGDWSKLGELMDCNFETRKIIYGEECLGKKNLQMIEIARKYGANCKFPGRFFLLFLKGEEIRINIFFKKKNAYTSNLRYE